jgi:hypothetical protein
MQQKKKKTLTRDKHPRHRRDSNPQSQQASGRRPTPEIAQGETYYSRISLANGYEQRDPTL